MHGDVIETGIKIFHGRCGHPDPVTAAFQPSGFVEVVWPVPDADLDADSKVGDTAEPTSVRSFIFSFISNSECDGICSLRSCAEPESEFKRLTVAVDSSIPPNVVF